MNRKVVGVFVKIMVKFNTVLETVLIRNLIFYCWLNFNKRNNLFATGYDFISSLPLLIVSCLYSMTGGHVKNMLTMAEERVTSDASKLYVRCLLEEL